MKKEHFLQLIGIAIFLIGTSLTYGIVKPVNEEKNASLEAVTDKITNTNVSSTADTNINSTANITTGLTENTTDDTSKLITNYRIMTAITVGGVLAIVAVFFLGFW